MKKKRIVYRGFLAFLLTNTPRHLVEFSPCETLKLLSDPRDEKLLRGKYVSLCRRDPAYAVRAKHSLIKDILAWAQPAGEE